MASSGYGSNLDGHAFFLVPEGRLKEDCSLSTGRWLDVDRMSIAGETSLNRDWLVNAAGRGAGRRVRVHGKRLPSGEGLGM